VDAGADYRFGFRAAGKASDLVELCKKYGLQSTIVEPVMDSKDAPAVDGCSKDKGQVSTTRIRKALAEGDMKRVAELLGRNHRLYIEVKDFVRNENVISFPIANVLNQPPTVGSYECSLYLEGTNDNDLSLLQVRIQETDISLELQDSSLVNKITQQSRIALDFLA
jgi:FAD synthase